MKDAELGGAETSSGTASSSFDYLESKATTTHIRVLLSGHRSYIAVPGAARLKTESLLWRIGRRKTPMR